MDALIHIQGNPESPLAPLILVHAISGLALPYLGLGSLSNAPNGDQSRPIYGISSPIYESPEYRPRRSLSHLAAEYVAIVREQVQTRGPYLLGGWSMGGMIAIEMASIFRSQGDEVQHILLIDSMNPELYPAFKDNREHRNVTAMTYNNIVKSMNAPELVIDHDDESSSSDEDWGGASSDISDSDSDNDDDILFSPRMLYKMQRHISHGLHLLGENSRHRQTRFDLKRTDVTLIKCTILSRLSPHIPEHRKVFARKMNQHLTLGWNTERFRTFTTLKFSAQHDTCFDAQHVGELTKLMRDTLVGVRV